jgi:ribosomal 30S subunit maturation factor RimM
MKENIMTQHQATTHATSSGNAFAFARTGYDRADLQKLTTDELESATVLGRNDETIGTISSLILGADGKVMQAVVEVGGFLGMGTHSVLLPFSDLTVLRSVKASDLRVHLDTTKARLKAMPEYTA